MNRPRGDELKLDGLFFGPPRTQSTNLIVFKKVLKILQNHLLINITWFEWKKVQTFI